MDYKVTPFQGSLHGSIFGKVFLFGWWGERRGFGEVGGANWGWGWGGGGCHINLENIYRSERKRVGGCLPKLKF